MFSSVTGNSKLLGRCGRLGNALVFQWVLTDNIIGGLNVDGGLTGAAVGVDGGVSIGKGNFGGNMQVPRQPILLKQKP